ncbi:MAG: threonylcarbamoyl-AMP synthase [Candidatus Scalindua sediminis]|nr:threonylcarbamoyl-AMP synthase [Candidatus Scalindua sediminis]
MATELLNLRESVSYWGDIEKAALALLSGKIVAFPTETLYGIGVNANDSAATNCLYRVKQRPESKKLAIMIAEPDDVTKYVKEIPPIARILIKSFWPGPLTIVFALPDNKSIGFRNSSNRVVRDLIKFAKVEIASTSANISGEIPATDAQQVITNFGDKIDVVLDDGPTQFKAPSTVVKIMDDKFEIIRHGVIEEERINRCLDENCLSFRS